MHKPTAEQIKAINEDDAFYVVEDGGFEQDSSVSLGIPEYVDEKWLPMNNISSILEHDTPIVPVSSRKALDTFVLCDSGFIVPSDTLIVAEQEGYQTNDIIDFLASSPSLLYGESTVTDIHVPTFGAALCPEPLLDNLTTINNGEKILVRGTPEHHIHAVLPDMSGIDGVIFSCLLETDKAFFFYDSSSQKITPVKSTGLAWFRKDIYGRWVLMTNPVETTIEFILPSFTTAPTGTPFLVNIDGVFYYLPSEQSINVKVEGTKAYAQGDVFCHVVAPKDGFYTLGVQSHNLATSNIESFNLPMPKLDYLKSCAVIRDFPPLAPPQPTYLVFSKCHEIDTFQSATNLSPSIIRQSLQFRASELTSRLKKMKKRSDKISFKDNLTTRHLLTLYLSKSTNYFSYHDFWSWSNKFCYSRNFFIRANATIVYSGISNTYISAQFKFTGIQDPDIFEEWPCAASFDPPDLLITGSRDHTLTLISYFQHKKSRYLSGKLPKKKRKVTSVDKDAELFRRIIEERDREKKEASNNNNNNNNRQAPASRLVQRDQVTSRVDNEIREYDYGNYTYVDTDDLEYHYHDIFPPSDHGETED